MSRFARSQRTFFVEEPVFDAEPATMRMDVKESGDRLFVCTPRLPPGLPHSEVIDLQRTLLDSMIREHSISPGVLWFYTPMALNFARHLAAPLVVYDCMDELSAFAGAPKELRDLEAELFKRADLVFTGGHSLYRSKVKQHPHVHAFPSSVDAAHFSKALGEAPEPPDQASLARPRMGFFGVIDERLDLELVAEIAEARPDWQIVMLGPVVKIDPATLPRRPNIHWLGQKSYAELPSYLAGWDVALMPFALNEATKFISPTKTLEYLAAGKAVVSTAITDVVQPYEACAAVRIAGRGTFVEAIESALAQDKQEVRRVAAEWAGRTSWDSTWQQMSELIEAAAASKTERPERKLETCSIT
jgi:UDP-galactopyranose mutase